MKSIASFFFFLISFVNLAQQNASIDFLTAQATLNPDFTNKQISGTVLYTFEVIKPTTSVSIDAQQMELDIIQLDGKKVAFQYDEKKITIKGNFKPKATHTLLISYTATPKKALYFLKDYQNSHQIWTQGQGKYTSNWLPSFDDMNEKVTFDITIAYNKECEVIANGKLIHKKVINDSIQHWQYDMKQPMSSYLLAFAIGKYKKIEERSESGIPLEMFYYPADSSKVEYTYKHTKQIFDFLEKEIGYPFPWQNYKQIPVKDFLYAGMENTGTTIFSDAFVVDKIAFNDRNYISVNAHELAHQWFGDLVTETEGTHHWLQEGFATYYALLAEKEIFGEDYFQYKLYESAEQLTELSKTDQATSLLDPKASSLTFYQRGAWSLHALRNLIGDRDFKMAIHNYLEKYKYKNVTTNDFISIVGEVSGKDLSAFKKMWLEDITFPSQHALDILTTSDFIKEYLLLAQQRTQPMAGKWGLLKKALEFPINDYMGQEVIYQLREDTSPEALALMDQAFTSNNLYVRQTIANTVQKIPLTIKESYETLLEDPSYATIEPALYHLWSNFPSDREKYLEKTKDVIGFNDKNVRILWLVLALSTEGYKTDRHQQFYKELSGYTDPIYNFSTRENAFTYLESLQSFSDQSLKNLIQAAMHHNWRFRNFSRKLLDTVLKTPSFKKKYVVLKNDLPQEQQEFLQKKLTP